MRTKAATRPVDVSKGLFMDLAFLLIAALVLLVREPAKEEKPKEETPPVPTVNVRVRSKQAQQVVVDVKLSGQHLGIEIAKDGTLTEFRVDGPDRTPLAPDAIAKRLQSVTKPRTVVLRVDKDVPYEHAARVREQLEALQVQNEIKDIVETVANENTGK